MSFDFLGHRVWASHQVNMMAGTAWKFNLDAVKPVFVFVTFHVFRRWNLGVLFC